VISSAREAVGARIELACKRRDGGRSVIRVHVDSSVEWSASAGDVVAVSGDLTSDGTVRVDRAIGSMSTLVRVAPHPQEPIATAVDQVDPRPVGQPSLHVRSPLARARSVRAETTHRAPPVSAADKNNQGLAAMASSAPTGSTEAEGVASSYRKSTGLPVRGVAASFGRPPAVNRKAVSQPETTSGQVADFPVLPTPVVVQVTEPAAAVAAPTAAARPGLARPVFGGVRPGVRPAASPGSAAVVQSAPPQVVQPDIAAQPGAAPSPGIFRPRGSVASAVAGPDEDNVGDEPAAQPSSGPGRPLIPSIRQPAAVIPSSAGRRTPPAKADDIDRRVPF
jgi:hypothetical protein